MTDQEHAEAVRVAHASLDKTLSRCIVMLQDAEHAYDAAVSAARHAELQVSGKLNEGLDDKKSWRLGGPMIMPDIYRLVSL